MEATVVEVEREGHRPGVEPGPSPSGRSVRIGGRRYPVLLPNVRDPRMHVAAVIVSVQVLGQVVLGFDLSIAQILLSLGTAAVLEVSIVAVTRGELAWPASALLTGNGVALILRTPGTEHGDWWSTQGWPIFVAAAGFSLLSKYAIQVGGRPLFNPSNLGLVVVFLVFGSQRADPQDLWWGPWSPELAITLAVILLGGFTLSRRLHLFSVALTFWVCFAAGIAVVAASGHAITARWHLGPVAGFDYWWVVVGSPEIVIFVFFMITDPRTAPVDRVARPIYAAAVAVLASILAGLQTTEFATKVSILLSLTLVCAARPLLERWWPDGHFRAGEGRWWRTVGTGSAPVLRPSVAGVGVLALVAAASAGGVRLAALGGDGVRDRSVAAVQEGRAGGRPTVALADGDVPVVTRSAALDEIAGAVSDADAQRIGRDLVEDLRIIGDARHRGRAGTLAAAAFGPELRRLERAVAEQPAGAPVAVAVPAVASLEVVLLRDPVNPQSIPQLGVIAHGELTTTTYERPGSAGLVASETVPFSALYLVTSYGGHHLIGDVLPVSSPMVVGGGSG